LRDEAENFGGLSFKRLEQRYENICFFVVSPVSNKQRQEALHPVMQTIKGNFKYTDTFFCSLL